VVGSCSAEENDEDDSSGKRRIVPIYIELVGHVERI
jgi:hypothetical protein